MTKSRMGRNPFDSRVAVAPMPRAEVLVVPHR